MYVESWHKNHRFYLLQHNEAELSTTEYSHILCFGSIPNVKLEEEAPTLFIKKETFLDKNIIDVVLSFVGEAFVESYRFKMLISYLEEADRAISAYLIGKHATIGENQQEHKAYLDIINPEVDRYNRDMIRLYEEMTGDDSLQDICDKIWRKI